MQRVAQGRWVRRFFPDGFEALFTQTVVALVDTQEGLVDEADIGKGPVDNGKGDILAHHIVGNIGFIGQVV